MKTSAVPVEKQTAAIGGLAESRALADWDHLPDIGLYMDQVVTFLERQLGAYRKPKDERVITPSMINNYTKAGVIPRAESKKYSQEHMALLLVVCTLKQVMSMPDLTRLLSGIRGQAQTKAFYESFRSAFGESMAATADLAAEASARMADPADDGALRRLALTLAVEARARSFTAERILSLIENGSPGSQSAPVQ